MASERDSWKPDSKQRIANFLGLSAEFKRHLAKATLDDDRERQRLASTEIMRARLSLHAFLLLQQIDAGELQRDDLTGWELTAIDVLDR